VWIRNPVFVLRNIEIRGINRRTSVMALPIENSGYVAAAVLLSICRGNAAFMKRRKQS